MADEAQEVDELMSMFQSSPGVQRDSPITAAKYNKWLVGEQNRAAGQMVRKEIDSLRKDRMVAAEKHREYGNSLKSQSRDQMDRDISLKDQVKEHNRQRGIRVRDQVAAQKAQEEKQKQEWIAHGRNLAMKDQLQRQKIKQVVGENSKRVAEMTAIAKQEELDYERNLREVRDKLKEDNIREVRKVRQETADEVIDAAKEFAFEQRKALAFSTKAAEAAWRDERHAHTKAHPRRRAPTRPMRSPRARRRRSCARRSRRRARSSPTRRASSSRATRRRRRRRSCSLPAASRTPTTPSTRRSLCPRRRRRR